MSSKIQRYSFDESKGAMVGDDNGEWCHASHIAAPVVERQPVAIVTGSSVQWLPGAGSVKDRAELYAATPELAELQATIARLTAENEAVKFNLDKTDKRYLAAVAEIERLKGGQGEQNQCDGCQAGIPLVNGTHRMGRDGGYPDLMGCTAKLYASQPAPASMVLQECKHGGAIGKCLWCAQSAKVVLPDYRAVSGASREQAMCATTWNACLDKLKELNQ
jgi:hypothetical protein